MSNIKLSINVSAFNSVLVKRKDIIKSVNKLYLSLTLSSGSFTVYIVTLEGQLSELIHPSRLFLRIMIVSMIHL